MEIKFRAWHSKKKCWHYFSLTQLIIGEASKDCLRYENWNQYTGKKDRNGVDVYADDIVQEGMFISVVRWDKEGSRFVYKTPTATVGLWCFYGYVIGNTKENADKI